MKIEITGNVPCTEAMRDKIEKQLTKLDKYHLIQMTPNVKADVTLEVRKTASKIKVVIHAIQNITLKAECSDDNIYDAVDKAVEKIEGQIRKYKTKYDKTKKKAIVDVAMDVEMVKEHEAEKDEFIKTKEIILKPMDINEAILQMETLGHDFFAFHDVDTGGVSVVYKNKSGYGLLETRTV